MLSNKNILIIPGGGPWGFLFLLLLLGFLGFGYNFVSLSLSKITVYSPRAPKTNIIQAITHASMAEKKNSNIKRTVIQQ